MQLTPLATLTPASISRSWHSVPHPTLPLLATSSSDKVVRIYNLSTLTQHSTLDGGHKRSIRCTAWKPHLRPGLLSLVTASFDATAGVWRRDEAALAERDGASSSDAEREEDWEFTLVLEGHDSELKGVGFSPSGQYLATCSRDKSVWIWEEIGAEGEDEWETVAVLQEHEADVKCVAWGEDEGDGKGEVLASGSYDDSIRLWREDEDQEWACVAILKGHTGTVWGLDWEGRPNGEEEAERDGDETVQPSRPRRLISCSADESIRVWTRLDPSDPRARAQASELTSSMQSSGEEAWTCEATLPKAHSRPIYSVSWSKITGRVVSCGSDSLVVVYEERPKSRVTKEVEASTTEWVVVATLKMAHGPYEINHVTWCPRFDGGRKGEEEGIVTAGDDGAVRMWAIEEDKSEA